VRLQHLNLRVRDARACRDFYEAHFGFLLDFEADGGYFVRAPDGFLLALVPTAEPTALPDRFHLGFCAGAPDEVLASHRRLAGAGVCTSAVEDLRPDEDYVRGGELGQHGGPQRRRRGTAPMSERAAPT
jgi:catechol 2,3-dioxygenase-like lactoylglutathione lyase family enzyme